MEVRPSSRSGAFSVYGRLLTAEEAAERLGISKKTVYRYGQLGILDTVKFESNVRFPEQGLLDFIEKHMRNRPRPVNGNGAKRRLQ